jgi:nucleoside-diphosphate-sugar epimerase
MADDVTLITGASGFFGHAIMKLLPQDGRCAIGLDPVPSATADIIDDLSDRARLKALLADKKVTHIIHAGGVSGPMVMPDDPIGVIAINVAGSLNLLRAATESGVKTFIYCSSVSALGNFYENEPVGEDYPLRHGDLRSGTADCFYGRENHQCRTRRQSCAHRANDGLAVHLYRRRGAGCGFSLLCQRSQTAHLLHCASGKSDA